MTPAETSPASSRCASATSVELLAALAPLLDEALALSADARAGWLAALRQDAPALAAEVEALLEAEAGLDARGFLQIGLAEAFHPRAEQAPPLAGRRIGAYTLERPLGRGGMGSVWLAQRSDGRYEGRAALKLLDLAPCDAWGAARFRREGTVLAQLAHANIARLIDAGVTADEQPYLVLEYVEGRRIDVYCEEEQLSLEQRLALFQQVLAAVGHAHAALVVHRDLKPSNILVAADGTVKLLDFGIATLLDDGAASASRTELTAATGLPLTPRFAAPEQVAGGPVTTATDVYALGVLLFLLLAGRHPTGDGATTADSQLRSTLEVEPPRLSDAGPAALRRRYRGDLDNIVARALKKAAAERYQTVEAFAEDLRRYLASEPVLARPDTLGYRARKFVRRHRRAVGAGAALAIALVMTTAVALTQMLGARRQRDEARAQRDRAVLQERRAVASSDFAEALLQSVAPAGRPYTTRELLARARARLERDASLDPAHAAQHTFSLARHYAALQEFSDQLALLQRADSLAASAGDDETAAHVECALALAAAQRLEPSARGLLDGALTRLARVREPGVRVRAQCLLARAQLTVAERRTGGLALAREATTLLDRAGDTASLAYVDALEMERTQLGASAAGRASLVAARRVVATLERTGRAASPRMVQAWLFEAVDLRVLGEVRTADSVVTAAALLALRVEADAAGRLSHHVGDVALALGHADSAASAYARSVAAAEQAGDTYRLRRALERGLVPALAEAGRADEASAALRRLQLLRIPLERGLRRTLEARVAEATGDTLRAYQLYMASLTADDYPDDGTHLPLWHHIAFRAARAALSVGDAVAADTLARRAIRLSRALHQDDSTSADIGQALVVLARARLALGDSIGARAALHRAHRALAHGLGADHPRARAAHRRAGGGLGAAP